MKRYMKYVLLFIVLIMGVGCANHAEADKKEYEREQVPENKQEEIISENKTFYPALNAEKTSYHYIDESGNIAIEGSFSSANPFSDGLALVYENDHAYFIDGSGKHQFSVDYTEIEGFLEGYAVFGEAVEGVEGAVRYGFIDKQGDIVVEPIYYHVVPFSEGKALAVYINEEDKNELHMIDQNLEITTLTEIENNHVMLLSKFNQGYAEARIETVGLRYVVDLEGNMIKSDLGEALYVEELSEGVRAFYAEDEHSGTFLWGYMNVDGKVVIKPSFYEARPFVNRHAAVQLGEDEWTFINEKGKTITDHVFDDVGDFSEGIASVQMGSFWGAIDLNGELVIEDQFAEPMHFVNGVARILLGNEEGYINKQGNFIYLPISDYID